MDPIDPPCDLDEVRRYRLSRVRRALAERDFAGIVLYGQVNTRYATDSTNMQIWSTHNEVRMVSFDADFIGPYGYRCDISRSWVCGAAPTDEQRRLYADAHAQIEHNKALLGPGLSFRELTERLRPLGEEFVDRRYGVAMHRVGLCDEYPAIRYPQDWDEKGYDGVLTEGMVMCVEALAAPVGGREAVKPEEQVLITESGFEQLSSCPLEESRLKGDGRAAP